MPRDNGAILGLMPEHTEILQLRNDLSEVERACDVLRELWVRLELPEELEMPVTIALEEVLSNVLRHGCAPGQDYEIQARYQLGPPGIEVEIVDNARAFDPLALPAPDLTVPLEQRRAGGMGVLLVRKLMDEVRYEYRDGRNRLLFRKQFPVQCSK